MLTSRMRWLRVFIVVIAGALAYYYRSPLQDYFGGVPTNFLRATKREEEVKKVFVNYADLFIRGDPRSENIYLPNATLQVLGKDAHGLRRPVSETPSEHRAAILGVLPKLRSGQWKLSFADVQYREQTDGKVRVTYAAPVNGGPAEQVSMLFVNTAPQRWAVAEEVHADANSQ